MGKNGRPGQFRPDPTFPGSIKGLSAVIDSRFVPVVHYRLRLIASQSLATKTARRPVSRVLSAPLSARTTIPLGRALRCASRDQPGRRSGNAPAPLRRQPSLFGLAPGGVYPAAPVARRAVRSCRTVSPLPAGCLATLARAVCFLWHFPWGRPRRPLSGTVFPWSPDFPPSPLADQRPSGRLAIAIIWAPGKPLKPRASPGQASRPRQARGRQAQGQSPRSHSSSTARCPGPPPCQALHRPRAGIGLASDRLRPPVTLERPQHGRAAPHRCALPAPRGSRFRAARRALAQLRGVAHRAAGAQSGTPRPQADAVRAPGPASRTFRPDPPCGPARRRCARRRCAPGSGGAPGCARHRSHTAASCSTGKSR